MITIDKKILLILPDMVPRGVTSAAVSFCNGLAERGAQVDLLVMSDCADAPDPGLSESIRVLRLRGTARRWNLTSDTVRSTKNPMKKGWYLFLGGLKRLAKRQDRWLSLVFRNKKYFSGYDAMVAYRHSAPCYYFALHNVNAKKKVAFVHGDVAFMDDVGAWQPYMKEFDTVAYVSEGVKEGFIARYPELAKNAVTVYNTFPVDELRRKAGLPCPLSFDRGRMNLVTVSYIKNIVKGTGRIAPICQKLKEKYSDQFHWYVVGDGPDLEGCRKKAEKLGLNDHLTFLGADPNPYRYLAQADVCVFPTVTEAFPLIVGESLLLGVPVIASRYPAVEEIIADGQNGLVAEQNSDVIFERISRLFDDRALLAALRENCESYHYDNDRSYKQFMDAIQ